MGIYEAFEAIDVNLPLAEEPPRYGFGIDALRSGWQKGRAGTDWGLNQSRYEGDIQHAIAGALAKKGYDVPTFDQDVARTATRVKAAGGWVTPGFRRTLEDSELFWGMVADARRNDPNFMSEFSGIVDSETLSLTAHARRNKDEAEADRTYLQSSTAGKAAHWLGRIATAGADPLSYIPVGGGLAQGTTTAARILNTAGREAAINAGITLGIEPLVRQDAAARGEERTALDTAVDVGIAGAFGGILGGIEGGVRVALGDGVSPDVRAAANVLDREIDVKATNPFEPDPDGMRMHTSRLAIAMASLEADQMVPDFNVTFRLPVEGNITSHFGPRAAPIRGGSTYHRGIDIAAPQNSPVQATGGGVVVFAGPDGANGNIVRIDHGNGVQTSYGHLHSIDVQPGEHVGAGDRLGGVGSTGRSTGNHLHYAVKVGDEFVDPMAAQVPGGLMSAADIPVDEVGSMAMSVRSDQDAEISVGLDGDPEALQSAILARIDERLRTYELGPAEAAMAHLDAARSPFPNVESRRSAVLGRAHAMMENIFARHRRDVFGRVRDPAGLRDVVREAFGETTGNLAAREIADAWGQTSEMLRQRFNRAGGHIGKLEGWGLPQTHSSAKVRRAPYDEWRDFTVQRLDRERMIDEETGEPMSPQRLESALQSVYESIRTEGWSKRTPGAPGGKMKANQRAEHRFLAFRNSDAWLEYQERFGAGSPYDTMMAYMSGMSRDIALMEVLGPNPAHTIRWLQDRLMQDAHLAEGDTLNKARGAARRVQEMYDTITGDAAIPVDERIAAFAQGTRSLLTSAFLGRAAISALTDIGFQRATRKFNGLPVTTAMKGYLKLFRPYMSKDQRTAIRLGLIADEASKMASAMSRYTGETYGPELMSRVADGVLRISGLSPWTQAGRWAFGMEFLGALADMSDRPFSKLPPALQETLTRYGIGSGEWSVIRNSPLYEERGATFLRPAEIADEALGDRVLEMVLTETDYAVPTPTLRARSYMNVGTPGTLMGEIVRSALLFKSFGISLLMTHGRRMIEDQGYNRLRYTASLAITTTLLGALAIQLKDISKGKDPRPMGDARFWGAALLQGGGFGIFGDFLASTENRFGGGVAESVAGPVAGFVGDVAGLGWEATKDEPNYGRQLTRIARRYTPGQSVWYAGLAFERAMMDQMGLWLDDDYDEIFDRMENYAGETGQDYWWAPGEMTPDRAPDYANAITGEMPD